MEEDSNFDPDKFLDEDLELLEAAGYSNAAEIRKDAENALEKAQKENLNKGTEAWLKKWLQDNTKDFLH